MPHTDIPSHCRLLLGHTTLFVTSISILRSTFPGLLPACNHTYSMAHPWPGHGAVCVMLWKGRTMNRMRSSPLGHPSHLPHQCLLSTKVLCYTPTTCFHLLPDFNMHNLQHHLTTPARRWHTSPNFGWWVPFSCGCQVPFKTRCPHHCFPVSNTNCSILKTCALWRAEVIEEEEERAVRCEELQHTLGLGTYWKGCDRKSRACNVQPRRRLHGTGHLELQCYSQAANDIPLGRAWCRHSDIKSTASSSILAAQSPGTRQQSCPKADPCWEEHHMLRILARGLARQCWSAKHRYNQGEEQLPTNKGTGRNIFSHIGLCTSRTCPVLGWSQCSDGQCSCPHGWAAAAHIDSDV